MTKNYRSSAGIWLANVSIFSGKGYKDISRSDILSFLDSYRVPNEKDPLHKSTGTYNFIRIQVMRFIRWLYDPESPAKGRSLAYLGAVYISFCGCVCLYSDPPISLASLVTWTQTSSGINDRQEAIQSCGT